MDPERAGEGTICFGAAERQAARFPARFRFALAPRAGLGYHNGDSPGKSAGTERNAERDVNGNAIWKKYGRMMLKILGGLVTLGMLAGLYLTLIIGQPQPEEKEELPPQPLLTASPAVSVERETDLRELLSAFPAPMMSFMSGSGMTFVSGTSADAAWRGQFGRILTLYWQTREGQPLILQSIYPAEALGLMSGSGYHFSAAAGPALFGQTSVRMENADTVRLHVQAEGRGLYVVTVPKTLASEIGDICRSIQLFVAGGEDA